MWTLITFVLFVPVLCMCALAVFRLFAMCIVDRLISPLELTIIMLVVIALIAQALSVEGLASIGALLLLVLVLGLIPSIPHVTNAVHIRRLLRDDIRKYHATLEKRPDVPYPHMRLAEIHRARQDWDRAIEHYEAYITRHSLNAQAKRSLERCIDRKRIRDSGLRLCFVCGAENPAANFRCQECRVYLKGGAEIMSVLTTPGMMAIWKWLIVWPLAMGVITGLPMEYVPSLVSVILLWISVIATVVFVYGRLTREDDT